VDCRSLPFLVGNCGLTSIAISREKLQNVINPVFLRLAVETNQGDQIGRIFAFWAIVLFGQRLKKFSEEAKFLATFIPLKKQVMY
jgi:hypothetical protein